MPDDCPFIVVGKPQILFSGKWLYVKETKFKKPGSDHLQTKPDGVDVIATLKKNGKKYFVLIKQYRFPLEGFCIEFPAGLIDPGEEALQAGLRELKEETGYTATKVVSVSPGIQSLDPGITDDSVVFVTVEIDGDAPENLSPKQSLDEGESLEVLLVECDKILDYINSIAGTVNIETMVYTFAVGFAMGRTF
ncbi:unnamed protein product [Enterobius vermicularis]|uniref:Nudix hydrolase domain-containing protein n=1 Tax=Enterobius vermicularis TaxID=51028 RepID=A0A0N4V3X9_ENTVE|nr:unnamed protein product [Enterobius vermicularis]